MASVTEIGRFTTHQAGSATTAVVPVSVAVGVGEQLVMIARIPAATPFTSASVADTAVGPSNTWVVEQFYNATANLTTLVATCTAATALTTSDTITLTGIGSTGTFWLVWVGSCGVVGSYDQSAQLGGSSTLTPFITAGGAAATNHQLVIAGFGFTGTTHTMSAGSGYTAFSALVDVNSPTQNLFVEWQEYNASGTRTANGTMGAAGVYAAVMIQINADPPAPAITFTKTVTVG